MENKSSWPVATLKSVLYYTTQEPCIKFNPGLKEMEVVDSKWRKLMDQIPEKRK